MMGQRGLRAILLYAVGVFLAVSWLAYRAADWPAPFTWRALSRAGHACGPVGMLMTCLTPYSGRRFMVKSVHRLAES